MSRKLPEAIRRITISFAIPPELLKRVDELKVHENDRSRIICELIEKALRA